MKKSLIIVESPAKAKTIKKAVGKGFEIVASMGHVRDLPRKSLGVDIEHGFAPKYITIKGKGEILKKIKDLSIDAEKIFLASDPDREGEAISWHIADYLKEFNPKMFRVLFNEITERGIKNAMSCPGKIDLNKVNAQQARRVLDRIVGYMVSPFLWKTIPGGLSAGRVQTVALRLVCEREDKIDSFVKEEYWTIDADLLTPRRDRFRAGLYRINDKKFKIKNQEHALKIISELKDEEYRVLSIEKKEIKRHPLPPFITSSLQQAASGRFNFSPQKTMILAQKLYEGVEIKGKGSTGLITYMRTDSFRVSEDSIKEARTYINENFPDLLPEKEQYYKPAKKTTKIQDAHEAIRPTSVLNTPDLVKKDLSPEEFKLYDLIWRRFVASQMKSSIRDLTTVDIEAGNSLFRAVGTRIKFDGFQRIYDTSDEQAENILPLVLKDEIMDLVELIPEQHFTQPPARFTEASLVKELETRGIGRPSTYATIINTLISRKYVILSKKKLSPTELGRAVNRILISCFPEIFDVGFTAEMENDLDRVELGEANWEKILADFYDPFKKTLDNAMSNRKNLKKDLEEKSEEVCELCGAKMVIKWGRHGRFLACPNFPECKNARPLVLKDKEHEEGENLVSEEGQSEETNNKTCPDCGSPMLLKKGKFGKFYACSKYPGCKKTIPFTLSIPCQKENCPGEIVQRKTKKGKFFYGCSQYPKCDFITWDRPVKKTCPNCNNSIMFEKSKNKKVYYCYKCKFKLEEIEELVEAASEQEQA